MDEPLRNTQFIKYAVGPLLNRQGDKFLALYAAGGAQFPVCSLYPEQAAIAKEHFPEIYALWERDVVPNKNTGVEKNVEERSGLLIELKRPVRLNTIQYGPKKTIKIDPDNPVPAGGADNVFDAAGIVETGAAYLEVFTQLFNRTVEAMPSLSPDAASEAVRSILYRTGWSVEQWVHNEQNGRVPSMAELKYARGDELRSGIARVTGYNDEAAQRLIDQFSDQWAAVVAASFLKVLIDSGLASKETWPLVRQLAIDIVGKENGD